MLSFLKGLFLREKPPVIETMHEKLGAMVFDSGTSFWETKGNEIFHSMPGTSESPSLSSIEFINSKLNEIDKYWNLCQEELLSIAHNCDSIDKTLSAKELFKISSVSVNSIDNSEWEICFETKPDNKWLYIGLHFQHEEIVANDIST